MLHDTTLKIKTTKKSVLISPLQGPGVRLERQQSLETSDLQNSHRVSQ